MNTPIVEWLQHAASKGTLVLGLALLAGLCLRRVAAARRYAVWLAALGSLALLPLAMALLPAWRVLPAPDEPPLFARSLSDEPAGDLAATPTRAAAVATHAQPVVLEPLAAAPPSAAVKKTTMFPTIFWHTLRLRWPVLWLAGIAVMLLRLAWGAWRLRRLEKTLPEETCGLLPEVARDLGLRHLPRVHVGAADAVPMVWGFWRARLLLPRGFAAWPQDRLRSVLLHELAHLRRRDPLALWVAQGVKALHWFNPLAWLTFRHLRADQERACDDAVLRHGVRPSDYAQHLLDLSSHTRMAPGLALCALAITRCAPVEARVRAVLDAKRSRQPLTRRWLAGMAALALLTALPVAMLHAIEGSKLRGRILDRHGVVLAESTAEKVRSHPLGTLVSHVVGYTGKSGPDDSTPTGRAGQEKQHEAALQVGKDVALTLDVRLQKLTSRAMLEEGFSHGAAVVLDPRNGDILASVSLPAYDPNDFIPAMPAEQYKRYVNDPDTPMLDRGLMAEYPPAAAFMPFTALAGLSVGTGNPIHVCSGSITYGSRTFQCWKGVAGHAGHGGMDMQGAITHSCDCYWYQFGNATGLEAFEKLGGLLGFGSGYGLAPGESKGHLPTQADRKKTSRVWNGGDMANLSIGQGEVSLTPLQLSVLAATVANGGRVPQPRFVRDEEDRPWRADLTAVGQVTEHIALLREGMRLVVNGDGGTGKAARSSKHVIAAKTGTAQWRMRRDQNLALMIGFAPYDQPRLAFAVLYEGRPGETVSGGHNCAPVVKRIVEEALALPTDGSAPTPPAGKNERPAGEASATANEEAQRPFAPFKGVSQKPGELRGAVTPLAQSQKKIEELHDRLKALRQEEPQNHAAIRDLITEMGALFMRSRPQRGPAELVRAAEMGMPETARWEEMHKSGGLAALPSAAQVHKLQKEDTPPFGAFSQLYFRFSADRGEARAWLLASLSEKARKVHAGTLSWPAAPAPFTRIYFAGGGCQITLESPDGRGVQVTVTKYKMPPLIAPTKPAARR